ncbi:hypothetical protein BKA83DRAFT_4182838 [Pisolithus microcarpus]|nr:hypothetical protein BKA83DRAFT_4182838 [Pisolithus microcarpus]
MYMCFSTCLFSFLIPFSGVGCVAMRCGDMVFGSCNTDAMLLPGSFPVIPTIHTSYCLTSKNDKHRGSGSGLEANNTRRRAAPKKTAKVVYFAVLRRMVHSDRPSEQSL